MSRSKHTDPRSLRAARRLRALSQPRGAGDSGLRRKLGRMLKELNGIAVPQTRQMQHRRVRPRIVLRPPSRGFHHPIGRTEVREFLESVGPLAMYGLRLVELARGSTGAPWLVFGRYEVPGRIVLFEQPLPPWRLPGVLKHEDARRLKRAGALITSPPGAGATVVEWPDDALKWFMLEEVLLHEVGHHVLQQHKGKRPVRIARTKDHEAFAARFAARTGSLVRAKRTQP